MSSNISVTGRRSGLVGLALSGLFLLQLLSGGLAQAADDPPQSYQIKDVPLYAQWHTLSCEYASARMVTAFWGHEISEAQFIKDIPTDPNPHRGFRGNIDGDGGWVDDYGVYAAPIANYLTTQGFETKVFYSDVNALKAEIALGRPVIVWVTIALIYSTPVLKEVDGSIVRLVPGEHAVVITGYDENGVYLNGPAAGIRAFFGWADFERTWGYFDNMALSMWR